jgi:cytochrome c-type biogenesis protein CcmF
MIPELGHFFLCISTAIALLLAWCGLWAPYKHHHALIRFVKPLAMALFLSLLGALICLATAFLTNDFSVTYVANHSNSQLANFFKVAAIWGSHEGSMLFWVSGISLWGLAISRQANIKDVYFLARLLAILAIVILGFNLFMLFTSNPFDRSLPNIPIEGRDLNPILQNIGLILHPPMLFLGYVGLTVSFASAVAILLGGDMSQQHAAYLRPWVIITWIFMTAGNAFGSWWAYQELGWGGWWFWDPVENASFIPWLVSTALLHSIILTHKQASFKKTTLILCLLAFSLSLLGTFLVRSGIVQSVHAFAADPTRGVSILILLGLFVSVAMLIFATQAHKITSQINHAITPKETLFILGIVLLVIAAFSVLLGTFYPLIYEMLQQGTISVGAPYFNSIFIPLACLIVVLMGLAPLLDWRQRHWPKMLLMSIVAMMTICFSLVLSLYFKDKIDLWFCLGNFSATWLLVCLGLAYFQQQCRSDKKIGMFLAHFGVAVSIIGATVVSNFEQETLLRMGPGQGKPLANYIFVYQSTQQIETSKFDAIQANIQVLNHQDELQTVIRPQRQTYKTNAMEMSKAGIHSTLLADLYITLGVPLGEDEYLVRISYKPLVSWLWLGAIIMMLGGVWSIRLHQGKERLTQAKYSTNISNLTPKIRVL